MYDFKSYKKYSILSVIKIHLELSSKKNKKKNDLTNNKVERLEFDFKNIEKKLNKKDYNKDSKNNLNFFLYLISSISDNHMVSSFKDMEGYLKYLGEIKLSANRKKISPFNEFLKQQHSKKYEDETTENIKIKVSKLLSDSFSYVNYMSDTKTKKNLKFNFGDFPIVLNTLINKIEIVNIYDEISEDDFFNLVNKAKKSNVPFNFKGFRRLDGKFFFAKDNFYLGKDKIEDFSYGINPNFIISYIIELLERKKTGFFFHDLNDDEILLLYKIKKYSKRKENLNNRKKIEEMNTISIFEKNRLEKIDKFNTLQSEMKEYYEKLLQEIQTEKGYYYLAPVIKTIYFLYMRNLFENKINLINHKNDKFLFSFEDCIKQVGEEWCYFKEFIEINSMLKNNNFIYMYMKYIMRDIKHKKYKFLNKDNLTQTKLALHYIPIIPMIENRHSNLIEQMINYIFFFMQSDRDRCYNKYTYLLKFFDLCEIYYRIDKNSLNKLEKE